MHARSSCLALVLCCAAWTVAAPRPAAADAAGEALRRRLEAPRASHALRVGDSPVRCEESLRRFYAQRGFRLAWSDGRAVDARADTMLAAIRAARREGLEPRDYHLEILTDMVARRRDLPVSGRVDLDLLLTDAFLLLGTHYLAGHVDPASIDPEWVAYRRAGDMPAVLEQALARNGVGSSLQDLLPAQPEYARLRAHLARLRTVRDGGGWPTVPAGPLLEPGAVDPRVAAVAARLAGGGPAASARTASERYDDDLVEAVKTFQRRHGLAADGVIGPATLAAFDVPVERRIAQVLVNLERWRWLPADLGPRHVLVNIADQSLQAVVDGQVVLASAVIVGRQYRRTPVFSGRITHLVFRPYWEVPPSIAARDKLPELRTDPRRLVELGFQVFTGWGASAQEVDPLDVDWSRVPSDAFPYRLRQKPGPRNALGSVKFMFPNEYSVYLHDTSAPELFASPVRAFSSGCIRVQRPKDLARVLLGDDGTWSEEAIDRAMAASEPRTVTLPAHWMVHLQYWTCWVTPDGAAEYRDDLYGRDARVLAALAAEAPASPER